METLKRYQNALKEAKKLELSLFFYVDHPDDLFCLIVSTHIHIYILNDKHKLIVII